MTRLELSWLSAKKFYTDLTPRKSFAKLMIQDELTKLADEADYEEDEVDIEEEMAVLLRPVNLDRKWPERME